MNKQDTHLYVAYGSNINVEQMQRRCPNSEPFDVGMIQGYSLEFNKVATLCKDKDSEAPCVLWNITDEHEKALDRFEGYPYKYIKVNVPVIVNGEEIKAMAYVMRDSSQLQPPTEGYFQRIYDGYTEFGLDESVLYEAVDRAEQAQAERIEREYSSYSPTPSRIFFSSDELNQARIEGFRAAAKYAEYTGMIDRGTEQKLADKDILSLIDFFEPRTNAHTTLTNREADYKYYVAYGSNINLEEMARRCPNSKRVGVKMLRGYELVFDSCATVERNNEAVTPVLLWKIHKDDWRALDRYEGYPSYYRKENVNFRTKSEGAIEAAIYIMNRNPNKKYAPPPNSYVQRIVEGYKANGIDLRYLNDALTKNLELNGLIPKDNKINNKVQQEETGRKRK